MSEAASASEILTPFASTNANLIEIELVRDQLDACVGELKAGM